MYKKLILILFLLLMSEGSTYCAEGRLEQAATRAQMLTQKLRELSALDRDLKQTWSYHSLTIARATYDSMYTHTSFTFSGFLQSLGSVIARHYSPQILFPVGHFILPTRFQKPFETVVSYAFGAAHAYDVLSSPIKQSFGYACGFVGVYLLMNVLNQDTDHFYQKELQGLTYFCCREAGWAFFDNYGDQALTFLRNIPQHLRNILFPEKPPAETDFTLLIRKRAPQEDNVCGPYTPLDQIPPLSETGKAILARAKNSTSEVHPLLSVDAVGDQLSEQEKLNLRTYFYEHNAGPIVSFVQEAQRNDQSFGIFFGESHNKQACFYLQMEFYQLMSHVVPNPQNFTVFLEQPPKFVKANIPRVRVVLDYLKKNNITSEDMQRHYQHHRFTISEYAHVFSAGFQLEGADSPVRDNPLVLNLKSLLETVERLEVREVLKEACKESALPLTSKESISTIGKLNYEDSFYALSKEEQFAQLDKDNSLELILVRRGADFWQRDRDMTEILESHHGDFSYTVGSLHLLKQLRLLKNMASRAYLAITCSSKDPESAKQDVHVTYDKAPLILKWTSKESLADYLTYWYEDEDEHNHMLQNTHPCVMKVTKSEEVGG